MRFRPGVRVSLVFNPAASGEVEVLLLATAGRAGKEVQTLIARNVARDGQRALRVARDFLDSHMDEGPPASPYRRATPPLPASAESDDDF